MSLLYFIFLRESKKDIFSHVTRRIGGDKINFKTRQFLRPSCDGYPMYHNSVDQVQQLSFSFIIYNFIKGNWFLEQRD